MHFMLAFTVFVKKLYMHTSFNISEHVSMQLCSHALSLMPNSTKTGQIPVIYSAVMNCKWTQLTAACCRQEHKESG